MYEEILGMSEKIKKILPNLNEMPHKSGSVCKGNKTADRQNGKTIYFIYVMYDIQPQLIAK